MASEEIQKLIRDHRVNVIKELYEYNDEKLGHVFQKQLTEEGYNGPDDKSLCKIKPGQAANMAKKFDKLNLGAKLQSLYEELLIKIATLNKFEINVQVEDLKPSNYSNEELAILKEFKLFRFLISAGPLQQVQVPALARVSIYIRGQLNQLPADSDGDLRCLDLAYFSGFREEDIVQLTDTSSGEVIHKQEKDVPDGQQVGFFKRPEAGWASTYKMVLLVHHHGNISTSTALNGTGQSNESMSIQELSTSNIEMETSNKM